MSTSELKAILSILEVEGYLTAKEVTAAMEAEYGLILSERRTRGLLAQLLDENEVYYDIIDNAYGVYRR